MTSPAPSLPDFREYVDSISATYFEDEASRKQALQSARSLVHRLETPMETMLRIAWTEPGYAAALKICLDLGLFKALAEGQGFATMKTVGDLAGSTGSDPVLVRECS